MKKKIIILLIVLLAIIFILWITTVIPKFIAKQVAINYTKNINMWLSYTETEYNKHFECWTIGFVDKENNTYNINVSSKYFPFRVTYDGVYQSSSVNTINYNESIPKKENTNNKTVNEIEDITTESKWDVSKVNIKIKEGTLTNEGDIIIITDKNENTISWGVDFLVEVKKGEQWLLVPQKAEVTWIEIALIPNENGITEMDCNWKALYGKLESGTYRIVKNSYSKQYVKVYSEPFTIQV